MLKLRRYCRRCLWKVSAASCMFVHFYLLQFAWWLSDCEMSTGGASVNNIENSIVRYNTQINMSILNCLLKKSLILRLKLQVVFQRWGNFFHCWTLFQTEEIEKDCYKQLLSSERLYRELTVTENTFVKVNVKSFIFWETLWFIFF